MSNRWKEIWGKKKSDVSAEDERDEFAIFCELKKADGFDVAVKDEEAYYRAFYREFERLEQKIREFLPAPGSIYELGCGSGVNLWLLRKRFGARIGGLDYSASLLETASRLLGEAELFCGEAKELATEPKYDLVMEESVFEYFPSGEYAEEVAERMIRKSSFVTYFGGIYDKEKEADMMEARRAAIPDYEERYRGLGKMFYERGWFEGLAKKHGRKILFTAVDNPQYWNGNYQYNCFIYHDEKG